MNEERNPEDLLKYAYWGFSDGLTFMLTGAQARSDWVSSDRRERG